MYLRLKVQTFWVAYQYVPVHTLLQVPVQHFSYFWRVHAQYILILREYVLWAWVPDSIARLLGLAGLLAGDSGAGPCIKPNHTKALAVLFTQAAAWQHPCQCQGALPGHWRWRLAGQLLLVSFTRLAAAMISCLLTSSTSPSQQHSALCKLAYSSNPAKFKFRDFIREIKQRADLAWSWAVQTMTGMLALSSI